MTAAGTPPALASTYRDIYRAQFDAYLEDGTKRPFLIPLYLCGSYLVPALYLAIPHRQSPWLYRARWPLLACLCWFHAQMIFYVSSPNFAAAYVSGVYAGWTIIWNFTTLVWTRPQWDAKRVERRKRRRTEENGATRDSSSATAAATGISGATVNGDIKKRLGSDTTDPSISNGHANGHVNGSDKSTEDGTSDSHQNVTLKTHETPRGRDAQMECYNNNEEDDDVEYYWQSFPADGSFRDRLSWSFDYVSQFRMTGWNCAIPCLPPYEPPPYKGSKQLPLDALPNRSRDGYTRTTDRAKFLRERVLYRVIPGYIAVDLLAVVFTNDPYFIAGPEHGHPLPPSLAVLHPLVLYVWRQMLALLALLVSLTFVFNFGLVCMCLLGEPIVGFRAHPWHLPSVFGSFDQVLDRGLSGFWGSWWHQTFRFGFAAPTKWLLRNGYIRKGTPTAEVASFLIAFLQSGLIHVAGSWSTVPRTKWWMPPLTFLLSGVGSSLQKALARLLWRYVVSPERVPRWARRMTNLAFVLVWMSLTAWPLLDDFGRCGLYLFEPVPFSFFRGMTSIGDLGDRRVWRWGDPGFFPRWYSGSSIWNTGIGA